MVAAAIVGGAVIGGVASNMAANKQSGAAKDASNLANDQFNQNRADAAPWRDAGTQALSQLTEGTAEGGDFNRDFTLSDFNQDPGYQFRMDEGMRGLESSAAARGGLLSGGTLKALDRFNQQFASGEYSNAYNRFNNDRDKRFNRLASVAGLGQTATRDVAQQGTALATEMGNNGMQAANARASGYIGTANAINGGAQSLGNWYQGQQASGGFNYGGGVGSSGWQAGGPNGTNDAGYFSNSSNANDWFLRNGSSGD